MAMLPLLPTPSGCPYWCVLRHHPRMLQEPRSSFCCRPRGTTKWCICISSQGGRTCPRTESANFLSGRTAARVPRHDDKAATTLVGPGSLSEASGSYGHGESVIGWTWSLLPRQLRPGNWAHQLTIPLDSSLEPAPGTEPQAVSCRLRYRTGAPGPSGMPSAHQARNKPSHTTNMINAHGNVKEISVPMPAFLFSVWR